MSIGALTWQREEGLPSVDQSRVDSPTGDGIGTLDDQGTGSSSCQGTGVETRRGACRRRVLCRSIQSVIHGGPFCHR